MRLVLVRHGQSEHTMRHVIGGPLGCSGLTERGRQQAHALRNRLIADGEFRDCVALLSSPVPRARETASILLDALPIKKVEEDCGLCEIHPGEADGLAWEAYRARYGAFDLQAQTDRPFSPGGESWRDLIDRVEDTLDRFAARFDGRTVVAVSHAGFIVVSFLLLFAIPVTGRRARLDPLHTSLTEWQASNGTWSLVRYNDVHHLNMS
ncbi:MAG: histidine phosphatase family protein [Candidatus Limnocylindrales bacterium]